MKTAIVILSDPAADTQEGLGRLFNGLAAAYDFKQAGAEVQILFHGTATRWPAVLADDTHPAHGLYREVADTVAGVSCACAEVFGASEGVATTGLELITDNPVPGTTGLPSLAQLTRDGFQILTF